MIENNINVTDKLLFNDVVNGNTVQNVYQKIGDLKIDSTYVVIYSFSNNIKFIEPKSVDGKVKYIIFDANAINKNSLNDTLVYVQDKQIINYIYNSLQQEIKAGKFNSKQELIDRVKHYQRMINNSNVEETIKNNVENYDQDKFLNQLSDLLKQFDEYCKTNSNELDMKNISTFERTNENGTKESFLARKNLNGSVDVVKNSNINTNVVDEFKERQNQFVSNTLGDGIENADSVFDDLKEHVKHEEVFNSIDKEHTTENKNQAIVENTVIKNDIDKDNHYDVSNDGKIFIDRDTQEVVLTDTQDDKVKMTRLTNDSDEQKVVENNSSSSLDINEDTITIEDIDYILNDETRTITLDQRMYLENLRNNLLARQKGNSFDPSKENKPKTLVLTKPNAYTNIFLIAIIMQLTIFSLLIIVLFVMKF